MSKFIGKSNERILCKLSKSEILRLYSIVHVAMETTTTSNFTCQANSFISIFFYLPSFYLLAATFLLPWFDKWPPLSGHPRVPVSGGWHNMVIILNQKITLFWNKHVKGAILLVYNWSSPISDCIFPHHILEMKPN